MLALLNNFQAFRSTIDERCEQPHPGAWSISALLIQARPAGTPSRSWCRCLTRSSLPCRARASSSGSASSPRSRSTCGHPAGAVCCGRIVLRRQHLLLAGGTAVRDAGGGPLAVRRAWTPQPEMGRPDIEKVSDRAAHRHQIRARGQNRRDPGRGNPAAEPHVPGTQHPAVADQIIGWMVAGPRGRGTGTHAVPAPGRRGGPRSGRPVPPLSGTSPCSNMCRSVGTFSWTLASSSFSTMSSPRSSGMSPVSTCQMSWVSSRRCGATASPTAESSRSAASPPGFIR
jgi:hypothetical protein